MFGGPSARLMGRGVNPDARQMVPVMRFFYDGQTPAKWEDVTNFRLPLHAFAVATIASFTRSYLLSNDIVNIGALILLCLVALNLSEQLRLPHVPVVVTLMTLLAMPFVATYVAQPMQYIAGTTISFLAVIAVFALSEDDLRRPLIAAVPAAVMVLNYDPYIYAATAIIYLFFVVRFRRAIDYVIATVLMLAPVTIWTETMRAVSNDHLTRENQQKFISPVIAGWREFFRHPVEHALQPFLMGHIGLHIGAHFVLATIYWPALVTCVVGLWLLHNRIPRTRRVALIALLVVVFVGHQMMTAAFDWENNPRRALPCLLAFSFAYVWMATQVWPVRAWRYLLIALLIISATLTLTDRLFKVPTLTYLPTGQAIQRNPKDAMGPTLRNLRLDKTSMPAWVEDEKIEWHDLTRARLAQGITAAFFSMQILLAILCCALLWLLARAQLLPRYSAVAGAVIWMASAVRFI